MPGKNDKKQCLKLPLVSEMFVQRAKDKNTVKQETTGENRQKGLRNVVQCTYHERFRLTTILADETFPPRTEFDSQ